MRLPTEARFHRLQLTLAIDDEYGQLVSELAYLARRVSEQLLLGVDLPLQPVVPIAQH